MNNEEFTSTLLMLGAEPLMLKSTPPVHRRTGFGQLLFSVNINGENTCIRSESPFSSKLDVVAKAQASVADRYGAVMYIGNNQEVVHWLAQKLYKEENSDGR